MMLQMKTQSKQRSIDLYLNHKLLHSKNTYHNHSKKKKKNSWENILAALDTGKGQIFLIRKDLLDFKKETSNNPAKKWEKQ